MCGMLATGTYHCLLASRVCKWEIFSVECMMLFSEYAKYDVTNQPTSIAISTPPIPHYVHVHVCMNYSLVPRLSSSFFVAFRTASDESWMRASMHSLSVLKQFGFQ